jgi:hypothetical protein
MSGDLPKGAIAVCINNTRYTKKLTLGKEYLVKNSQMGRLLIEDDNGFIEYFQADKFKVKK